MMVRLRAAMLRLAGRFRRDDKAVAAVEFALIMPFMLMLYFGSMEAAALFIADKRVNSVSATIGDLVSQWDMDDGAMPQETFEDYLAASLSIISPDSGTGLAVVVSLVKVNDDGSTRVLWSLSNAAGVPRNAGDPLPKLGVDMMINQVARGGCVLASEASYGFSPMLAQVFTQRYMLAHTNFLLPRFGSQVALNVGDTDVPGNACYVNS
jgi:hypothetical protein